MRRSLSAILFLIVAGSSFSARALDVLTKKAVGDQEPEQLRGHIEAVSPDEVEFKDSRGTLHSIPVSRIESLRWDSEPKGLFLARNAALRGAYDEAVRMFEDYERMPGRFEAADDVAYYPAYCRARQALASGQDSQQAAQALKAFLRRHRGSYHTLEAWQLLGDLNRTADDLAAAADAYRKLGDSKDPGFQRAGRVALGDVLLQQGKLDEAKQVYAAVKPSHDGQYAPLVFAARVGTANCLLAQNQVDQAVAEIERVLHDSQEDAALYGRAYLVLGRCYQAQAKRRAALLAFLKVDVLYSQQPRTHAEALFHLALLWPELTLPEARQRAQACRNQLKDQYPNSPWAQKLIGGGN